MSREILFRGKRTDNGEWTHGYLFRIWEKAYICWGTVNDIPDMKEVDPETVCQYTGLIDKNGRKIFEGDVLNVCFKEGKIGATEKIYQYTVEFYQSRAAFELSGNDDLFGRPCFVISNKYLMEVVGNIFES